MEEFVDDFDFCRSCIDQDEQVLWKGRPSKGRLLGLADVGLLVIGLLFLSFCVLWMSFTLRFTGTSIVFTLWGIPFVVIGVYLVVGRLIRKAYLRPRTLYVVTNKKLIIKAGHGLKIYEKQMMPPMRVKYYGDGHGTIIFFENGYNRMGVRRPVYFALENLEDVKQAQKALAMME